MSETSKSKLEVSGISIREVARQLNLSASAISQILRGKYRGSAETIKKVKDHIDYISVNKVDLNAIIYAKPELFLESFIRNLKDDYFNSAQLSDIVEVVYHLKKYIEHRDKNNEQNQTTT